MAYVPPRPPTCLQDFVCRAVPAAEVGLPADADFNTYVLECPCGQDTWSVEGTWFEGRSCFVGPLFAVCTSCGWRHRLIDLSRDGYDASIGDGIDEGASSEDTWACPRCGLNAGQVAASLGYQYDEESGERASRHDLFDAFILTHLCTKDEARVEIAVFECA